MPVPRIGQQRCMEKLPAGLHDALKNLSTDLQSSFSRLEKRLNDVQSEVAQLPLLSESPREAEDEGPLLQRAPEKPTAVGVDQHVAALDAQPLLNGNKRSKMPKGLEEFRRLQESRRTNEEGSIGRAIKAAAFATGRSGDGHLQLHPQWMQLASTSDGIQGKDGRKGSKQRRAVRMITLESTTDANATEEGMSCLRALPHPLLPHSQIRLLWDVTGMLLLLLDTFALPLVLAWDLELEMKTFGGILLTLNFWFAVFFWGADIFMNLNTCFYSRGVLVTRRGKIVLHYLSTYFMPDVLILSLDVVVGTVGDSHPAFRSARFTKLLRGLRILRLLKFNRFSAILEEASAAAGRQWILLVVAMVKTGISMALISHILCCAWFWIGRSVFEDSSEGRPMSWLEVVEAQDVQGFTQYLHSMQWILCPPAPVPLDPRSLYERLYNILNVVFTLIVMGSALGKMTGTMAELRMLNSERDKKRREVRTYLRNQDVPIELTARTMRFVDHKLKKQDANAALDISLISPTLQMELYVSQRSKYLLVHPLLELTFEAYPQIFASICAAFEKRVYEEGEEVFLSGSLAKTMVFTATGSYMFSCEEDESNGIRGTKFTGSRWFAESAVFADPHLHVSSLTATSFGDALHITGESLVACMANSPGCSVMYCEYSKEFITQLRNAGKSDAARSECARKATHNNQRYRDLYPNPKQQLENINMTQNDSICEVVEESLVTPTSPKAKENIPEHDPVVMIEQIIANQIEIEDVPKVLHETISELHPASGTHVQLEQPGEREKSESACLSLLALVMNNYDLYTKPQAQPARLKSEQWDELQKICSWINPSLEHIHACVVLLAIRSLGKSKAAVQQLPSEHQRPEAAVMYMMKEWKNVVPSVTKLSAHAFVLCERALFLHEQFNLAQMLQGENVPGNVLLLKDLERSHGDEVFHFYMLFLLGFMSGLAGGAGSRFMNNKNAQGVIAGLKSLENLAQLEPQLIYWNFMAERAEHLEIPTATPEDLSLVRLACLIRVQGTMDMAHLRASWHSLSSSARETLVNHFMSDGIDQRAFVLEFLPLCMSNAKANASVKLTAMLEIIVDLLNNLGPFVDALAEFKHIKCLHVDLSDMAEFISVVQNRFVFQTCITRCKVRVDGKRLYLEMTGANWSRTNDADSDMSTLAHEMKELLQKMEGMETKLAKGAADIVDADILASVV